MIDLSIIVPAFNEEERLTNSVRNALDFYSKQKYSFEMIVVDDGSTDRTYEIALEIDPIVQAIKLPINMGKGAAVREGMLKANGKVRLFSDADFSSPAYETPKLLEKIYEGYDIAIGSRAIKQELIKQHQPFYREWMGKTFNRIVQLVVLKGINDTQCGFKAYSQKAAELIFSRSKINGFAFDVESLFLARKLNLKIAEVPVEWYNDDRSKVNPIFDSLKMLKEIMTIRKLHRKSF